MKKPGPSLIVVYDAECGFCDRTVRMMRSLDWLGRLEWHTRSEPGLAERFAALKGQDTQSQMVSLHADGRAYGGFFAVRDIWLRLPLTFIPAALFYLPGVSLLGVPAYRWIARNRHRFKGRFLSCAAPVKKN